MCGGDENSCAIRQKRNYLENTEAGDTIMMSELSHLDKGLGMLSLVMQKGICAHAVRQLVANTSIRRNLLRTANEIHIQH